MFPFSHINVMIAYSCLNTILEKVSHISSRVNCLKITNYFQISSLLFSEEPLFQWWSSCWQISANFVMIWLTFLYQLEINSDVIFPTWYCSAVSNLGLSTLNRTDNSKQQGSFQFNPVLFENGWLLQGC